MIVSWFGGRDKVRKALKGGIEGSCSSSSTAGRSRISIDDIESLCR